MSAHVLLYILFSFVMGSAPSGLIVVRTIKGMDIRKVGSGNIGATNVRRVAGTKAGLIVLGCDILKGMLPILVVLAFYHPNAAAARSWTAGAAALAAVLGHIFPVFLYLKPSGKGVATALGAYILLAPMACVSALAFFAALTALTRRVSIGSMGAALILPLAVWLTGSETAIIASAIASAFLILLRHKDNIHRLRHGKEPRFSDPSLTTSEEPSETKSDV